MKRIVSILLSVIIIVGLVPATFAASLKGDIDGDGKVTSNDALIVLNYSVGNKDTIDKTKADINKDSKVNSADALEILRICVGISPTFDMPTSSSEIIALYCKALKTTYNKSSMTLKYTYIDSGTVSDLTDKKDEPYNDKTTKTVECQNGTYKSNGMKIESSNPGYNFDTGCVASASFIADGGNYVIKLTLKKEQCDVTKSPTNNAKAAFGFILAEATSGTTTCTGTTLELKLDSNGNAIGLTVDEPYICEYKTTVNKKTHSMKDVGNISYTATYAF